jgi:cytidyltransferase-like protein
MKTVVIVSGGFDPLHAGHVKYLRAAKELGDYLVVGVNSDEWLTRKKGKPFMDWHGRAEIVLALKPVDAIADIDDSDGSACDLIERVAKWPGYDRVIFANGGDRTATNIPEMNRTYSKPVEFVFGVGGEDKAESSSRLLKNWENRS